jgi:uncharacterized protein (TIGR02145 family)
MSAGLDATVGVVVRIFGQTLIPCNLPPYSKSVELWKAPKTVEIVTGNNQIGTSGQPLTAPLRVIVKDNLENPLAGVPVHFIVTQGGGSLTPEDPLTNLSGNAETVWTLGSQAGTQVVNAAIKNANGQTIQAVDFDATTEKSCPGMPTVTYEGKTYNTIQIGTQCWFKENLNVGVMIDSLQDQTNNGIKEKYCYLNLQSNCDIYGGLYQWNEMMQYVTTEGIQGICPTGWHLPTDIEWTVLINYLGGESLAGGKLKESGTSHWLSPNTDATNETGFTALPGGTRRHYGSFYAPGFFGDLYTSTQGDLGSAFYYTMNNTSGNAKRISGTMDDGNSVRCIRD